jgi:hypothetical protein
VPFHSAQFALNGMNDEHIREASWVVNSVVGSSSFMYGIHYNHDQFLKELNAAVEYIKKNA